MDAYQIERRWRTKRGCCILMKRTLATKGHERAASRSAVELDRKRALKTGVGRGFSQRSIYPLLMGLGLRKLTLSVFVQDNPSGVCLGRNQAEIPFERCDWENVPC